ncbi:MAG: hypothetical protein RL472_1714, partial [Pseudomonadota bacterium]
LPRHYQKAGGVVLVVFDMAGQHIQPIDFCRKFDAKVAQLALELETRAKAVK